MHSGSKLLHKTKTDLKTFWSSLTPEGTEPQVCSAMPRAGDRALTQWCVKCQEIRVRSCFPSFRCGGLGTFCSPAQVPVSTTFLLCAQPCLVQLGGGRGTEGLFCRSFSCCRRLDFSFPEPHERNIPESLGLPLEFPSL